MGNCLFGGAGEGMIRVVKSSGGTMEFTGPITVGCITNEFPGHAIYPSHDLFWRPLSSDDELQPGNSYYLLPINDEQVVKEGHVRSKSIPTSSSLLTPYRMSFDYHGMLKRSYTEPFSSSRYNNKYSNHGFWKVKLVITPEQLLQILSQENLTQEFVENMRVVAKCGNGNGISSSSSSFSDQWSFSSSRNSSKKDV
ncbi:uncharacterized protein [Euphorbia lathyris]|uniref:uncharacterized protein n=1 Tax=Euphorbia lathyris TaxID=212925 RepID=UPI0033136812